MTTATKLTIARVIMIPLFMVLFYLQLNIWALVVFILASLTDLADGYVARHYNQVSNLGKFLDPLADKILVFSAIVLLVEVGRFPAWAAMVVLVRELAVSGLRMVAATGGTVIAAGWSGKIKTASTMVGLCVMIFLSKNIVPVVDTIVMIVIVATTVYSGIEYFVKNRKALL